MNIEQVIARCASISTGQPILQESSTIGLTPPEFADRVQGLAAGLAGLQLRPQAVVGLLAMNSIAYAETLCATICAGLVSAPLNLRWSLSELSYAVSDANIEVLVVDRTFHSLAEQLAATNPNIRHLYVIGEAHDEGGFQSLELLFSEPTPLFLGRNPETPCLISYTGGTTGFPKGVVHTHTSLVSAALNMATASIPSKGQSYLIGVPLFHVSGFAFLFARLLQLDPMVILPQFKAELVAEAVREMNIAEMGLVPTMLQMLISDPAFNVGDFTSLRRIYYGASPISAALLQRVADTFDHVELTQVYGMTEVGVIMALGPQFHSGPLARPGACGQPLTLSDVRIERGNGEVCAEGEIGELVHYGPSLMAQYHNKPEETQQTFRNGGLRSGDAGFRDSMGVITLCDRVKDMVISGGENVYSVEVENAVASHPDVLMVAVIGVPDERFGEAVHAVIVPRPGTDPKFETIRSHCQDILAGYKCPRSIQLVDALPLSAMNKILKNVLRDNYVPSAKGETT